MKKSNLAHLASTGRLTYIDLLESIAIFFVILYHGSLYMFDFLADGSVMTYAAYFSRTILSTCVPLFFFANGYLLFNKSFDLKKHVYKTIKIIFLVFIWNLILLLLNILIAKEPISIKTFILDYLNRPYERGLNVLWYMGALICLYIFFPALKSLFDSHEKSFLLFTATCALLTFGFRFANETLFFFSTISHHSFGAIDYPLLTMFNPFRGIYGYSFVYFCLGGAIHRYKDKILSVPKCKRNLVSVIGIAVSCGLLFLWGVFHSNADNTVWDVVYAGYDTIFTFFNVLFLFVLSLNYTKDYGFIRSISCNTLGIYFMHMFFLLLINPYIKMVPFLCTVPFNLLYAFIILCVCLGISFFLKKIPILKKLV